MAEVKINNDNFPSNSNLNKKKISSEKKEVKKVVTGKVIQKKEPLSEKFARFFKGENADGVRTFIITEVLGPGIKDIIWNIVTGSLEMFMWGDSRGRRYSNSRSGGTYVNYGSYYRSSDPRDKGYSSQPKYIGNGVSFSNPILENGKDAEDVISVLIDFIDKYGSASISDLNDALGITSDNFMNDSWGWTNLSSTTVKRVREGYLINFPKPTYLQ